MTTMVLSLLTGEAKVFRHGKAQTLYVTIPSAIAQDSAFTIKEGETVDVKFDKDLNAVVISRKASADKRSPSDSGKKRTRD